MKEKKKINENQGRTENVTKWLASDVNKEPRNAVKEQEKNIEKKIIVTVLFWF